MTNLDFLYSSNFRTGIFEPQLNIIKKEAMFHQSDVQSWVIKIKEISLEETQENR